MKEGFHTDALFRNDLDVFRIGPIRGRPHLLSHDDSLQQALNDAFRGLEKIDALHHLCVERKPARALFEGTERVSDRTLAGRLDLGDRSRLRGNCTSGPNPGKSLPSTSTVSALDLSFPGAA
ncbi:MAG: hypothetical protein CL933_14590 [Deltaproteobacteria bacterium]|nr:hypothetical protein [Deltaproteobacteria bacterium]